MYKANFLCLLLLSCLILFVGCDHGVDSSSDLSLNAKEKGKNNPNTQALKFKKLDKPENNGPGGGDCPVTWIPLKKNLGVQ